LNEVIDTKLSGRPRFQRKELSVNGDLLEFYCRDIIESIRCLYGDPRFARHLVFAPERRYTNHERIKRMYNEMNIGDWWWKVQVSQALIIPNQTIIDK